MHSTYFSTKITFLTGNPRKKKFSLLKMKISFDILAKLYDLLTKNNI